MNRSGGQDYPIYRNPPTSTGSTDVQGRSSVSERSSIQERTPTQERSFAQERFMAQKRELQQERSMIRNRERSMYQDIGLGRDYVPFKDPETTWQGGMEGLGDLFANKMLMSALAVLGIGLLAIILMLIFRT